MTTTSIQYQHQLSPQVGDLAPADHRLGIPAEERILIIRAAYNGRPTDAARPVERIELYLTQFPVTAPVEHGALQLHYRLGRISQPDAEQIMRQLADSGLLPGAFAPEAEPGMTLARVTDAAWKVDQRVHVLPIVNRDPNVQRVEANVAAARPALEATVSACERLVAALDLPNMYDQQYAVQRETAAVEAALRELEPHRPRLPYLHAGIPDDARAVAFHAGRRRLESYQADLARQTAARMRGIIGPA